MKKFYSYVAILAVCGGMMTGCLDETTKEKLKDEAHNAIISYLQTEGQERTVAYIDQLVAEGKLGSANAERLKAALPKGIEELKKVMGEIEAEETVTEETTKEKTVTEEK